MKNFFVVICVAVVVICAGCIGESKVVTADMIGGKISQTAEVKPDPIEEQLKAMTLEEKIGQMMMIGFYGTEINDDIRYMLNNFHVGGIILFDRNMESVAQVKKLTDDLQALGGKKIPLLISTDEEGGRVARGKNFLEVAPSQESIGQSGDPANATHWAKFNANLLKNFGVNINLAPVADVGSRDTRSFGDDAQTVAEFVNASANGYESENFLYTLKHFPGIGKSKIDPHHAPSNIEDSREILDAQDLPPFAKIVRGHDNSKFMVMIGHLKYDAIDAANSASISPAVINGLLRGELGFGGVVITDDLEMGAIKNEVDPPRIGVLMIQAGGDIALACHNYEMQQKIFDNILDAVRRGEISETRIDESVRRILKLKANLS